MLGKPSKGGVIAGMRCRVQLGWMGGEEKILFA